jgi:hypothetical protein
VLIKVEPNTNKIKEYSDLPDILETSLFLILNNNEDETKYENVI